MVWLIDFQGWTMSCISVKAARETAHILQNHYPERLGVGILYNPPKVFESFWTVCDDKHNALSWDLIFLKPKVNVALASWFLTLSAVGRDPSIYANFSSSIFIFALSFSFSSSSRVVPISLNLTSYLLYPLYLQPIKSDVFVVLQCKNWEILEQFRHVRTHSM